MGITIVPRLAPAVCHSRTNALFLPPLSYWSLCGPSSSFGSARVLAATVVAAAAVNSGEQEQKIERRSPAVAAVAVARQQLKAIIARQQASH